MEDPMVARFGFFKIIAVASLLCLVSCQSSANVENLRTPAKDVNNVPDDPKSHDQPQDSSEKEFPDRPSYGDGEMPPRDVDRREHEERSKSAGETFPGGSKEEIEIGGAYGAPPSGFEYPLKPMPFSSIS